MKKLLSILLLISYFGIAQQPGTLLNPAAINGYTTNGKVLMTSTSGTITGVPTWTNTLPYSMLTGTPTIPSTVGLLPNTTSLTINGVTNTFTSTPSFTTTLQDVVNQSNLVSGTFAVSPDGVSAFKANGAGVGTEIDYNDGLYDGKLLIKHLSSQLQHSVLNRLDAPSNEINGNFSSTTSGGNYLYNSNATIGWDFSNVNSGGVNTVDAYNDLHHDLMNSFGAPNNNFPQETANSITYFDASKNLKPVTLGSGLSLSSGTLTATNTSSTTIVTGTNNITVSGSAPNYTVGVSTSPTFTNATLSGTTTLTGVLNASMTASAASSSTVDLSTWTGNYGHITGTVTITSFGTVQAGAERTITFDGSLTLTSNTVSLILPGATNIQTTAGDIAIFISEGSGNWRCASYMRADESYTNYTPTWTGFTAAPTIAAGEARYKMLTKNTCHVIIYPSASGTSNANTLTVTLPFAAYNAGTFGLQAYSIPVFNNGVHVIGTCRTVGGSNILNVYNGIMGATWTTGGVAKSAYISIVYQID